MSRWNQTWTCTACGHSSSRTVRYPKNGASSTPLTAIARRARCTKCRRRGSCTITEERQSGLSELLEPDSTRA